MLRKTLVTVLAAALLVTGCTATGGTKQTAGAIGGAVVGGLAGSRFGQGTGKLVATGVGTLLGAFVGSEIGASLDRADQSYMQTASQRAYTAPVGERITWNNPQSGNSGVITPTRDGYSDFGAYCREFQQTITVGGRTEQAFGKACQQPDGSWKIVQ